MITWIPADGSHWRNGRIEGQGLIVDDGACVILKGSFDAAGALDGANCECIDYSGDDVVIKRGVYNNGLENGNVQIYTFARAQWDSFVGPGTVSSAWTEKLYSNGIELETLQSGSRSISGSRRRSTIAGNDVVVEFAFQEN